MSNDFQKLEIEGFTHICPVCNYSDGFHVSYDKREDGSVWVINICPECHAKFDPEWKIK